MTTSRFLLVATVAAAGAGAALLIQHQNQSKLHEKQEAIEQQHAQFSELSAENQRLSKTLPPMENASTNDQRSELDALRARAATLRQQTNELAKQQASVSPKPAANPTPAKAPRSAEYYTQMHKMAGTSPTDGLYLGTSVRMYADDHEGRFPTEISQLTPYFAKGNVTPTVAARFEIVFQGSLDDLKNVPPSSVVLLRERQPWPAPEGQMGRVYGLADGTSQIITSDDNFQDWESKHLIHPPTAAQIRK